MLKKTLFFDDSLEGHHLEYIHHLYMNCDKFKDEYFIFMLPPTFKLLSDKLGWPIFTNVKIDFISENDYVKLKTNRVFKSYFLCVCLKKAIKKHRVSNVFLIFLMEFMPFLPFFIGKKVKVSGIVYLIYLYRWKNSSLITKALDSVKYILFSKSIVFANIYLLNDKVAPIYLNKKFKTSVFGYLPDPFMSFPNSNIVKMRSKFNFSDDKIVCLHFGALQERKGTIEILQAILEANETAISKCCFVFAGKIHEDIKERFYLLVEEVEKKTQIIVYDKFCEYDFLSLLCFSSNFILIPYKNPEQSSGIIGYAAQFKIPVLAPDNGLLGKLVKRYKLGHTIKNINVSGMIYFFNNIDNFKMEVDSEYLLDKSVSDFNHIIFS
jgi:hypothetical protein